MCNMRLTNTNLDDKSVSWSYTLLPDMPLAEAVNIPIPGRATDDLTEEIMTELVSLTISYLPIAIGLIL